MADALTPQDAERIARDFRGEHGLGERYALTIEAMALGRWRIAMRDQEVIEVDAMTRDEWEAWLARYYIEPVFEHDKTTEG